MRQSVVELYQDLAKLRDQDELVVTEFWGSWRGWEGESSWWWPSVI